MSIYQFIFLLILFFGGFAGLLHFYPEITWAPLNEAPIFAYNQYLMAKISNFLMPQAPQAVIINLRARTLHAFENGRLVKQYKVDGYGNPKISPTPEGEFAVLGKYPKRDSFGEGISFSYAVNFKRNYYIHGAPYYRKTGAPYNSPYSLGCIRLSIEDAKDFYAWVMPGAKVIIYNAELVKIANDPKIYQLGADGLKRHILSPEAFLTGGFRFKDVAVVPEEELNAFVDVGH